MKNARRTGTRRRASRSSQANLGQNLQPGTGMIADVGGQGRASTASPTRRRSTTKRSRARRATRQSSQGVVQGQTGGSKNLALVGAFGKCGIQLMQSGYTKQELVGYINNL